METNLYLLGVVGKQGVHQFTKSLIINIVVKPPRTLLVECAKRFAAEYRVKQDIILLAACSCCPKHYFD